MSGAALTFGSWLSLEVLLLLLFHSVAELCRYTVALFPKA